MAIPDTGKLDELLQSVPDISSIPGITSEWLQSHKEDAPVTFQEFDETIADDVEVCTCPTCGHEHTKK